MNKIYVFRERDGTVPFLFFFQSLDEKLQRKIVKGLRCLALFPGYRTQPHVKHFSLERYSDLFEYRERIRILFRVIYTTDAKGNIILLAPFVKKRDKDTQRALELAVRRAEIVREYPECRIELDLRGEVPALIDKEA